MKVKLTHFIRSDDKDCYVNPILVSDIHMAGDYLTNLCFNGVSEAYHVCVKGNIHDVVKQLREVK